MRILAVTFDSEMSGGANRSFLMVITELRKRYHHDIHVIIPNHGPLEMELQKNDFSFECIEMKSVGVVLGNTPKRVLTKLKANWLALNHYINAKIYTRRFKSMEFDSVYINCANHLFGCYAARELGIPYVWHFRGSFVSKNYYVYNQKKLYNDSKAKIIVISNQMKNALPKIAGIDEKQIVMIHNGMPQTAVTPAKQDWKNGIHCVLCGRIVRSKGHLDAINALGILKKRGYQDIFLHIAGDVSAAFSQYKTVLKQAIEQNEVTEQVIFEGQIHDMAAFREHMNIELMCSVCEPFGRVTVEGMRSGLIVIGSNTGGTIDIIQDGYNGYLYRQGNSVDLADKIQHVIDNVEESKMIVQSALAFSASHFTMEKNVEEINAVLVDSVTKYTNFVD